jgi:hypothetical protein
MTNSDATATAAKRTTVPRPTAGAAIESVPRRANAAARRMLEVTLPSLLPKVT